MSDVAVTGFSFSVSARSGSIFWFVTIRIWTSCSISRSVNSSRSIWASQAVNNVKLLSKTNPGPFFRHYDAIAVGFSKNFLSQWEQLNGSQTVSLMCSLVTNQLITDRKGATQIVNNNLLWGVSEQHFFMCTVNNMESNKKNQQKIWRATKKLVY